MATKRLPKAEVAVGDEITWTAIEPDGRETPLSGRAWASAPTVGGMTTWWVIPRGRADAVLVARASRRHLVGRSFHVQRRSISSGLLEWRSLWSPKGGRYVDAGEWFTETDPRSRFARTFVPPTHLTMAKPDATARTELMLFGMLCEAVERGEDVDLSVDADSVAAAAECGA